MATEHNLGKLALLVGGGPAPGINGVISSTTIEAINQGYAVIGFRDGYKWLSQGDATHIKPLTINDVTGIHLRGGSILGTSRANPTKSESDMKNVLKVYKHAAGEIRVAHVPKTIDNDLPLPGSTPTFGFETARHHGVKIVRSLVEDAKTTSRWYLIISMGRAAGHLALGIGKAAAVTLTIIPEEFRGRPVTLDELCDIIIGSIVKRRSEGSPYGVVVLAEGLIEAIGEKALLAAVNTGQLGRYGRVTRDEHNHLRLGEIEFGRMLKDLLITRAEQIGLKVALIDKDLGYELRSADPVPFDAEYTRDLGYGAVKFIRSADAAKFGAIISFVGGKMQPLPFEQMIDPNTRRMQVRKVNTEGEAFECARRYMIRLEKPDFEDAEQLTKLSQIVNMNPDAFKQRFGYLAGVAKPPPPQAG
jgi:6-phosphofructokinase